MDMAAIKEFFITRLKQVGYSVEISNQIFINFKVNYLSGRITIRSANIKKFEVLVYGNAEDLSEKAFTSYSKRCSLRYVSGRFKKNQQGVEDALKWVALANKSFNHLRERLNMVESQPEPLTFTADQHICESGSMRHGVVLKAKTIGLAGLSDRQIIGIHNPDGKPLFLVSVDPIVHQEILIVTDGTVWYPLEEIEGTLKVYYSHKSVEVMRNMTQTDRELIQASIRWFLNEHRIYEN